MREGVFIKDISLGQRGQRSFGTKGHSESGIGGEDSGAVNFVWEIWDFKLAAKPLF